MPVLGTPAPSPEFLTDLVAYLKANGSVGPIIGGACYLGVLGELAQLPALSIESVSAPRGHYLSGKFDGLNRPSVQIKCWDYSYTGAIALAKAVISVLDGFQGGMGSTALQGILVLNSLDDSEVYGSRKQYCRILEIRALYGSAPPTPVPGPLVASPPWGLKYKAILTEPLSSITLPAVPNPTVLQLYRNGFLQAQCDDYGVSANVIGFALASPPNLPQAGDEIQIFY